MKTTIETTEGKALVTFEGMFDSYIAEDDLGSLGKGFESVQLQLLQSHSSSRWFALCARTLHYSISFPGEKPWRHQKNRPLDFPLLRCTIRYDLLLKGFMHESEAFDRQQGLLRECSAAPDPDYCAAVYLLLCFPAG